MLGEKIGEARGKVTGRRVVEDADGIVKLETSFEGAGQILGVETHEVATFWSAVHAGGGIEGEGHGMWFTADGDQVIWRGIGAGRPAGDGNGASFRGCLTFQTQSARLGRLNGVCGVFEFEVDQDGNTRAELWEWN